MGFQILFLNCYKEANMFFKKVFNFYVGANYKGSYNFLIKNLDIYTFKRRIQLYLNFAKHLWLVSTIARKPSKTIYEFIEL